MSIVPVRALSTSDLHCLGNNVRPEPRRRRPQPDWPQPDRPQRRLRDRGHRRHRRFIDTLNRSLACVGEAIRELDPTPAPAAS
jgi:hypothetical protein